MNLQKKIMIADDNADIRSVVKIMLESEGFTIVEAVDGSDAIAKYTDDIDLFILDVLMPNKDGLRACMELRTMTKAPILFLTAKTQDIDKSAGLASGGDDYLSKPFSSMELVARVNALLRRYIVYKGKETDIDQQTLHVHDLLIHTGTNQVFRNGEEIVLTNIEYRLLLLMAQNRKKTFTAQALFETVWNEPYFYTSNNTIMVHIRNLRKKMEIDPQDPKYIINVWGKGYRIE